MARYNLQSGDVGIEVETELDLQPFPFFEEARNADCHLKIVESKNDRTSFSFHDRYLHIERSDYNTGYLALLIGLMVHTFSERYVLGHAAGFIEYGAGIALAGKHGSGKSTLSSLMTSELLDDDNLYIGNDSMSTLGNRGFRSARNHHGKYLLETDLGGEFSLDHMFLLDSSKPPSYIENIKDIDEIKDFLTPDTLDEHLSEIYLRASLESRVYSLSNNTYVLGTSRNPEITADCIQDICNITR